MAIPMQETAETIWAAAREILRTMLNSETYNLWFAPIKAASLEDDRMVFQVANEFCEVWLTENYLSLIQDVLQHTSGRRLQAKFQVVPGLAAPGPASNPPKKGRP